eukprot:8942230-Karenia_brevis.AAC.1
MRCRPGPPNGKLPGHDLRSPARMRNQPCHAAVQHEHELSHFRVVAGRDSARDEMPPVRMP